MSLTRRSLLRLLPAAAVLAAAPRLPAGENFGAWSDEAKARAAYEFFLKMRREFAERSRRLTEMGLTAPDTACPFLESETGGKKEVEQWLKFRAGKMRGNQAAAWTLRGLEELERARARLAAEEVKAAPLWDAKFGGNNANAAIPPEAREMIYEIEVQARKLAVILDNSPSMSSMLPAVREEIANRFPSARFVEVDSASLETANPRWGLHGERYFATPLEERNPFDPKWFFPEIPKDQIHYHVVGWQRDTLSAMRAMAVLMEVDAIYWFCDFDDDIVPAAVNELEGMLKKGGTRLYVHSVGKKPPAQVSALVKNTGGLLTRAVPARQSMEPVDPATVAEVADSPEAISANLNKVVKLTGVVDTVLVQRGALTVEVLTQSRNFSVSIRMSGPRKSELQRRFPPGRKFSAIGRLISVNGNKPVLHLSYVTEGAFRLVK